MASSTTSSQTAKNTTSNSATASSSTFAAAGRQRGGGANGVAGRSRPQNDSKSPVAQMRESNTQDKHANDRLLFLLATFVGNVAHITVKSGEQFTGIFSAASLPKDPTEPQSYVLKMAKRVSTSSQQVNGHIENVDEYVGHGENHTLAFDAKDVVHVSVANVSTDKIQAKLTNGTSNSFRTDTDISGNTTTRERELQRWEPTAESSPDMSLGGAGNSNWDQFETNERKFGVRTDYDESYYTTTIDRSAPTYKQKAAAAEKLAREIEMSATTNSHVAEERGQISEGANGMDEEDKFSGVKRDFPLASNQPNKYTPPARRAPASQAATAGTSTDPAIISAQLARPVLPTKESQSTAPTASSPSEPLLKKENIEPVSIVQAPKHEDVRSDNQKPQDSAVQKPLEQKATVNEEPESAPQPAGVPGKSSTRNLGVPSAALPNTTANVEREVLKEFKSFAAREKHNVTERARLNARKDREVKLNDLKKFANNFKLKTLVPADMLGILAKDKQKQVEIVEKSQRQLEEQNSATKAAAAAAAAASIPEAEQKPFQPVVSPTLETSPTPVSATTEKQAASKGPRGNQQFQNVYSGRNERTPQQPNGSLVSPKLGGPGNLGQRLLQQPQYRDRNGMQSFSAASSSANAFGGGSRAGSIPNQNSAAPARFNVQAMEFRPNPSAVSFSPTGERSSGVPSPTRTRRQSSLKPTNRTSFFPNGRPRASERKSIKDGFNPIARMMKEVEEQKKTKDYTSNAGIPQAYRTPPTWDTSEEYMEKSYVDMFDKPPVAAPSVSPANVPMPHQHQLPLHLQQGPHGMPSPHQTHQSFPQHQHNQGRDHRFDDHRMQPSASQSGHFSSPRMPVMAAFGGQMMTQVPSQLGQAVAPFPYPGAQGMGQMRPYPTPQFLATPGVPLQSSVIINQPGMPIMSLPVHTQSPMFSPVQGHVLQPQLMGTHNPGVPNGFNSPRVAPMMMHQGSQQGHAPPPHFYMNTAQHAQQFYGQQHQQQLVPHIRGGGVPMTHQQSFTSHLPQHFPTPQRQYSQLGSNFGHQAVPMDHNMSQQHHPPPAPMNTNGDMNGK